MNETNQDTEYRMRELYAALDRRIELLELRTRPGRGLQLVALLCSVGAFVLSMSVLQRIEQAYVPGEVASTLEARAIVLRDALGVERGALRVGVDGQVTLSLRDEGAQPRLRLSVLEDGSPGVSLLDSDGDARAILGFLPDGTTTLVFADAGSIARSVLALTPDGASRIVFSDHLGNPKAAVGVDGDGRPEMSASTSTAEAGG